MIAVGLVLFGGVAQGIQYQLDYLIETQTPILLGDKVFGDWTSSGCVDPSLIWVMVPDDPSGGYWIQFRGPFVASANNPICDTGIFYSLGTVNGQPRISDIEQAFNLTGGGGIISIGETVWSDGFFQGQVIAQSTVGWNLPGSDPIDPPGEWCQGDNLLINPPVAKVWVTKDIYVQSFGGVLGATIIRQGFSQVPDGGLTVLMLGAGMAGLAMLGRKLRW